MTTAVHLPIFEVEGAGTSQPCTTVPYTIHVDTHLMGVQGYDENVPIDDDTWVSQAMCPQFWVNYVLHDGFHAANEGTSHIDFTPYMPVPAGPAYFQGAARPAHNN